MSKYLLALILIYRNMKKTKGLKFLKLYVMLIIRYNNSYSYFIVYSSESFMADMRSSWLLPNHPNVARVLSACSQGDPVCVVSEWVMPGDGFVGGDLCEFLKQHSSSLMAQNTNIKTSNTGFVDVHNTSTSSKSSSVVTVTTSSSSPGSSANGQSGIR